MQGGEGMAAQIIIEVIYRCNQASHVKKIFHMWSPKVTGQALHHAEITFQCSSIIANTEGWDVGIQLVTSDTAVGRGSPEYMQLLADHCGEWTGCNHGLEAAGAGNSATLAAWGSTAADQANIDAGASSIVGINYLINLNAETAGVPLINLQSCVLC